MIYPHQIIQLFQVLRMLSGMYYKLISAGMGFPSKAVKIFFAVSSDMIDLALVVALPICGKIVQLSNDNKGLSVGKGSGVVTSSPAAKIILFFRLSYKSS